MYGNNFKIRRKFWRDFIFLTYASLVLALTEGLLFANINVKDKWGDFVDIVLIFLGCEFLFGSALILGHFAESAYISGEYLYLKNWFGLRKRKIDLNRVMSIIEERLWFQRGRHGISDRYYFKISKRSPLVNSFLWINTDTDNFKFFYQHYNYSDVRHLLEKIKERNPDVIIDVFSTVIKIK